jgi:DNA-binding transcriptional ArsR family regulator
MKNIESTSQAQGRPSEAHTLASPKGLSQSEKAVLELQASICKTMGHPIRLFLLHHLYKRGGEAGSSELANLAGISRAAFSQHLSKMAGAGLVKTRRAGKYVYVSLAQQDIGRACEFVSNALRGQSCERAALLHEESEEEA